MQLATGNTLNGKAGTATAVTYTVMGDRKASGVDSYETLGQGQFGTGAAAMLTTSPVAASTQLLIGEILITNTTASPVTGIVLYLNGTAAANQIVTISLVANGSATYKTGQWQTYDSGGATLGGSGIVALVTAADGSITIGGTATNPTVSRAALTGDVTASAGSNATTLAAGSASNLNSGTLLAARMPALTGDITTSAGAVATTLATVNTVTPGTFGSATATPVITVNGKGLTTASAQTTITPAIGSVTGLGTGVATALGTNVGSAGAPVVNGGALGTPSSGVATNLTGTASGLTAGTVTTNASLTGDVTSVGNATAIATGVIVDSDVNASANIAGSKLQVASTSNAGSQSATQFNTVANLWYDVTNYNVLVGNSGATNTANMNTLIQTTAPAGATFYFPQTGANYPFNGAIVVTKNGQKFKGAGDFNSVLFDGSTTDDLFRVQDGVNKPEFYDLGMWVTVTKVSGAAINFGTVSGTGNPQANIYRCGLNTFGGTWFNGIVYNGSRGAEVSKCEDVVINGFTNYGIALIGNTSTPATTSALYLDNVLMNGGITSTTGAVAGVFTQQSGAVQFSNCDIISCTNNYLAAPITSVNQVVASVYALNTYFDHSNGSCVKLGGTQPVVRCKFVSCSMTVNTGGNYSAFEISNTAANPAGDIDILNCNLQNTFTNVGTSNGLLISGGMNIKINNNNINGFTNNIQATPAASTTGVLRLDISGNSIGPGTVSGTTTTNDILLNAGSSASYGLVKIVNNNFNITNAYQTGATVTINDSSTISATGQKVIAGNTGRIVAPPMAEFPATLLPITTVTRCGSGWSLPANTLRVGSHLRISVTVTNAATLGIPTVTLKYGINNSNADADQVGNVALGTGSAALGSALIVADFVVNSATTATSNVKVYNGVTGTTGFTNAVLQVRGSAGPITIATNTSNFLAVYLAESVASVATVRNVTYEVIAQ